MLLMTNNNNPSVFIPFTAINKRMVGCHIGVLSRSLTAILTHQRSEKRYYSSARSNSPDSSSVVPATVYLNADTQKLDILRENKNKSGVYH
jgi:hypothetical protein